MKVLSEAGIVTSRREGKKTYYSLDRKALERMSKRVRDMLNQEPEKESKAGK